VFGNMKLFRTIISLFSAALILTLPCCSNLLDDRDREGWVEEHYPLCMMNPDGSGYKVIKDDIEVSCMAIDNSKSQIMVLHQDEMKFFNYNGEITHEYEINLNGITHPTFSFDQKFLTFMASDKGRTNKDLYAINADGSNLRKLTDTPNVAEQFPAFSHERDKIVYSTLSVPDYKFSTIEIMELDNGNTTVLHNFENDLDPHFSYNPFWYPVFNFNDEKVLFYWQRRNNSTDLRFTELYSVHVESHEIALLDGSASYTGAIVTTSRSDQALFMHLNGSSHLTLTNSHGQFFWQPNLSDNYNTIYSFSPTDNKFVYAKQARYNYFEDYIYVIDIETKSINKIRLGAYPMYSSDGKKIFFVGYERIEHN
jgi:hypothetical protein